MKQDNLFKDKKDLFKKFPYKLKNGNIVSITLSDLLTNNLDILRKEIPDLKVSEKLSEANPLKNIMTTLEKGIQVNENYYKFLSLIILIYIWALQIALFLGQAPQAMLMLFTTLWGSYAIVRLNVRPYITLMTFNNLLQSKDSPLLLSSIFYVLFGGAALSLIFNGNFCPNILTWTAIGNYMIFQNLQEMSYLGFLIIVSLLVSLLMGMYNIYSNYEYYKFTLLLKMNDHGLKICAFLIFFSISYFFPVISNAFLCKEKASAFMYVIILISGYLMFYMVSSKFFVFLYVVIKFISTKILGKNTD